MNSRKINFAGQDLYIGIDVHARQWKITVRTMNIVLQTLSINPRPNDLLKYLNRTYPGARYRSVYEAGFCGFWIHRQLINAGIANIVVNPADVPTAHKEKDRKTDKIDSRKLARELSKNNLTGIYIPSEDAQHLRSLCRARFKNRQNINRVQNRIKAHLHLNGIKLPERSEMSHWSARFISWLESLEFSHQSGRDCLDIYIEELQQSRLRLLKIIRLLRGYTKQAYLKATFELLYSVPGIGFVTAITFFTELMAINRFRSFDHLASYVGLVPSLSSSDEKITVKGMTNRKNFYLRYLIIESAWVAIRKDPVLLAKYEKLCKRMKKQDAIVRIAKKLLRRLYYVWINQEPYAVGID
jgi:transposase